MAKIKKNLSDAEMMRGFEEKEPVGVGGKNYQTKKILKKDKELMLDEENQARLNRFMLEMSLDWFKKSKGAAEWKVLKEQDQIVIKQVLIKKK
jgi:hypothetical protein